MNHLTPDELVDAVEATLAAARHTHLQQCPHCSREVVQLAAILRESRHVDVPEPSPLFWDHFSDRVRQAIAAEPAPRFAHWFEWPVLAPMAGLALLIFALVSAVPQGGAGLERLQMAVNGPGRSDTDTSAAGTSDKMAASEFADATWDVVSELVGDLDVETAERAGIAIGPGSAESVMLQLTSSEQQELVRLLRAEFQRAGG
ncbi:MAG: hypothetical protein H0T71_03425 [Acidobacteria bacterium]|nr:hypothetical protein [Acidobacteriota bacterium]